MKDLILFLAKSLVENPDAVQVTETEGPDSIILELNVAPEDMGKVIGKQGRIAKAIRSVLKAATPRDSKPVFLEIQEVERRATAPFFIGGSACSANIFPSARC